MNKFFHHPIISELEGHSSDNSQTIAPFQSSQRETLVLRVSQEDILWASRTELEKPMLLTLQRATGTLWRLYENGLGVEIMAPHRVCHFPDVVHLNSREGEKLLDEGKQEWCVELRPRKECEIYSRLQHRDVLS